MQVMEGQVQGNSGDEVKCEGRSYQLTGLTAWHHCISVCSLINKVRECPPKGRREGMGDGILSMGEMILDGWDDIVSETARRIGVSRLICRGN